MVNATFTCVQLIGGMLTGSVAILADAIHDLGDTISLVLAYYLQKLAGKNPDRKNTYGYQRYSLLSALISGIVIISGSIFVIIEAFPRLWEPYEVNSTGMIILACLGIVVNGYAFIRLSKGKTQNEKILKWHLLEDCAGWAVVLVGSIFIYFFHWVMLDSILAIGLAIYISIHVAKHFFETVGIFLQQTPKTFDSGQFAAAVKSITYVNDLHDLHIWSLDGDRHVLSCHVVITNTEHILFVKNAVREVAKKFGDFHLTIEIESEEENCLHFCEQQSDL